MKKLLVYSLFAALLLGTINVNAQTEDKSKRPSPPAKLRQTINTGLTITIDYSQPSVKGRTIGKDLEPMNGQIWRAGANEATVFELSKNAKVEGKELPAGKYAFFTIAGDTEWTLIFNKTFDQWGAEAYKQEDDALRVKVAPGKSKNFSERLFYTVGKDGKVSLIWGDLSIPFTIQ
ncbi:MAG: hypothetical protein RLZZ28_417 [Bacteroidota bacterium]|jgi:hypothetical protein